MNYYNPKDGKMLTENINFYQRDFFALYGENEILGWFSNDALIGFYRLWTIIGYSSLNLETISRKSNNIT